MVAARGSRRGHRCPASPLEGINPLRKIKGSPTPFSLPQNILLFKKNSPIQNIKCPVLLDGKALPNTRLVNGAKVSTLYLPDFPKSPKLRLQSERLRTGSERLRGGSVRRGEEGVEV